MDRLMALVVAMTANGVDGFVPPADIDTRLIKIDFLSEAASDL